MMGLFAPYDYVEDDTATVYVVRTALGGTARYLLYPAYRRTGRTLRRITHTGEHLDADPRCDWAADAGCVVRQSRSLRLVRSWDERRVVPDRVTCPSLAAFFKHVHEQGGCLFLYGSRLLDSATAKSDWDLLMTVERNPREVVGRAVARVAGARWFDQQELMALFTLPADHRPIAVEDLTHLLGRSLTYVHVGGVRVDIMVASRTWAEVVPPLSDTGQTCSASGVILSGRGESYLMPRVITLDVGRRHRPMKVLYTSWFLQGLEQLAGWRAQFAGLRRTGTDRYWFAARHSSLLLHRSRS